MAKLTVDEAAEGSHVVIDRGAVVKELNLDVATSVTGEGDPEIDALVLRRAQAKKARDFALADSIREELRSRGIEVADTKEGSSWKRISSQRG